MIIKRFTNIIFLQETMLIRKLLKMILDLIKNNKFYHKSSVDWVKLLA